MAMLSLLFCVVEVLIILVCIFLALLLFEAGINVILKIIDEFKNRK